MTEDIKPFFLKKNHENEVSLCLNQEPISVIGVRRIIKFSL